MNGDGNNDVDDNGDDSKDANDDGCEDDKDWGHCSDYNDGKTIVTMAKGIMILVRMLILITVVMKMTDNNGETDGVLVGVIIIIVMIRKIIMAEDKQ